MHTLNAFPYNALSRGAFHLPSGALAHPALSPSFWSAVTSIAILAGLVATTVYRLYNEATSTGTPSPDGEPSHLAVEVTQIAGLRCRTPHSTIPVLLTIDTETSMGGAWSYPDRRPLPVECCILCRKGEDEWGLPLIARSLADRGLSGTFFCEMLATELIGHGPTERYIHSLLELGHDVQLHIHPIYWFYARFLDSRRLFANGRPPGTTDHCSSLPPKLARELLEEGCELIQRFSGNWPAAFRAGGYAANRRTCGLLRELGVRIDSSYNPVYRAQQSFAGDGLPINEVRHIDGVAEFPVTVFRTGLPQNNGLMHLDVSAISASEMKTVLEHAYTTRMAAVVIVFHSFRTVKPKDIFYSDFRYDRIVANRWHAMLDYLVRNDHKFHVTTFGQVAEGTIEESRRAAVLADLGLAKPLMRKAVQAVNRIYWI